MYGDEAAIRALIVNKRSATGVEVISAAAAIVDARIDARLAAAFWWPDGEDGSPANVPPPPAVRAAANLLTAAQIESQAYAVNQAGLSQPNPYAVDLERRGNEMLDGIAAGTLHVPGLRRSGIVAHRAAAPVWAPVRGFGPRGR